MKSASAKRLRTEDDKPEMSCLEVGICENSANEKGRPFRIALFGARKPGALFGRHNWTRTNDPHHVKVVL